jgi:mRNA-degrading endonuclease toxin of MazEF toxin-antitoxin module
MPDKPVTVRRERIGRLIGHLPPEDMRRIDAALAFVIAPAG